MTQGSQYAYVLHQRPYTDSRLLIDLLTEYSGLVRVVARTPAKRQTGVFQCFQRMHVEYWGTSSLKTLRSHESAAQAAINLTGDALYCGMYINELLERLLPPEDTCQALFHLYETAVAQLAQSRSRIEQESILRHFEFFLLDHLGYAVVVDACAETDAEVLADLYYYFEVGSGVHLCRDEALFDSDKIIKGEKLLAVSRREFHDPTVLKVAKTITRLALRSLLGARPLKSKDLFR